MARTQRKTETRARAAGGDHLHQMVLKALRTEILRGLHPIGTALPSEAALVQRFGVSRHTVREALRQLRDIGLVESRQGFGTVVMQQGGNQPYVHRINSISDLHDFGVESQYFGETARLVTIPKELQALIAPGETTSWLLIDGLRYLPGNEAPLCEVEIFVAAQFAGVGRLLGKRAGPVYSLIEVIYGESIGDVEQYVHCYKLASANDQLGLPAGEFVVEIRRIYRTLGGDIAEITLNRYPADRFSMSMHLRRVRD